MTGRKLSDIERGLIFLSAIPLVGDGMLLVKCGKEFIKSARKVFMKEFGTNLSFMASGKLCDQVGLPPGFSLLVYQAGRIGYKYSDNIDDIFHYTTKKNINEGVTKAEISTCDSIKKIINDKGYSVDEFAQLLHPDRVLSDSEKLLVDSVRKEIGLPSADTLMCKTIPQSDIYKYLYNPEYGGVRVFTAVEEHVSNLKTLLDRYNGARLDYNNTAFKITSGVDGISQSVGLPDRFYGTIEYKVNDVDKISIPDWKPKLDDYPYTGKAFTGSTDVVLPEYYQSVRKFMNGDKFKILDSKTGEIVQQFIYDKNLGWLQLK